jgi:hypothetical protein
VKRVAAVVVGSAIGALLLGAIVTFVAAAGFYKGNGRGGALLMTQTFATTMSFPARLSAL